MCVANRCSRLHNIRLATPWSFELAKPLQRGASQPVGITCDRLLAVALELRHSAIECSNELAQVTDDGLV